MGPPEANKSIWDDQLKQQLGVKIKTSSILFKHSQYVDCVVCCGYTTSKAQYADRSVKYMSNNIVEGMNNDWDISVQNLQQIARRDYRHNNLYLSLQLIRHILIILAAVFVSEIFGLYIS